MHLTLCQPEQLDLGLNFLTWYIEHQKEVEKWRNQSADLTTSCNCSIHQPPFSCNANGIQWIEHRVSVPRHQYMLIRSFKSKEAPMNPTVTRLGNVVLSRACLMRDMRIVSHLPPTKQEAKQYRHTKMMSTLESNTISSILG